MKNRRLKDLNERRLSKERREKEIVIQRREETNKAREGFIKLLVILVITLTIVLIRIWVLDVVTVSGSSMKNTFFDGEVCLVKKGERESYERFDVVVAWINGMPVIKRIIGLPGEMIKIEEGVVFINGERLKGTHGENTLNGGIATDPYGLSEGEYFLMGDNRSESFDSRSYGGVKQSNIKGRIIFRLYPFDRFGFIEAEQGN